VLLCALCYFVTGVTLCLVLLLSCVTLCLVLLCDFNVALQTNGLLPPAKDVVNSVRQLLVCQILVCQILVCQLLVCQLFHN
jgi:hypothetical protein